MLIISLIQYGAVFFLGVLVTVLLSGVDGKPHFRSRIGIICALLLAVQLLSFGLLGLSATKRLYPLLVHLPLWGLLVLLLDAPKLQTGVSVLVAYMCCQIPRWVASLGLIIPESHWLYQVLYLPVAGAFLLLLWRYLAASLRQFLERSRSACLMMGLVPALYYGFDYVTTVYTGLLIAGNLAAVQFIPSVVSMAYLIFVVRYNGELEKQMEIARERDFLALQLNQSELTLSAMQRLQEKTRQYRHDMRHHFTLLQAFAAEKNLAGIQNYLETAQQDMEALTPVYYCSNQVVNLVLSYYGAKAKSLGVAWRATAALPEQLGYRETELCALLSNGLENAISAAAQVAQPSDRMVSVHMGLHGESFLIQMENTYSGVLTWEDGLPCATGKDHGLGTRSIRTIVRAHGGEAIFRGENGRFQLRILLPGKPAAAE